MVDGPATDRLFGHRQDEAREHNGHAHQAQRSNPQRGDHCPAAPGRQVLPGGHRIDQQDHGEADQHPQDHQPEDLELEHVPALEDHPEHHSEQRQELEGTPNPVQNPQPGRRPRVHRGAALAALEEVVLGALQGRLGPLSPVAEPEQREPELEHSEDHRQGCLLETLEQRATQARQTQQAIAQLQADLIDLAADLADPVGPEARHRPPQSVGSELQERQSGLVEQDDVVALLLGRLPADLGLEGLEFGDAGGDLGV